jgi:chromosomal replication initiator protein
MEIQSFLREGRHNKGWPCRPELSQVMISEIIKLVCQKEKISKTLMLSPQRGKYLLQSRSIAQYLSCKFSGKSLMCIGRAFNRDHTSVMYLRDKIEEMRKHDSELDEKIRWYEERLTA